MKRAFLSLLLVGSIQTTAGAQLAPFLRDRFVAARVATGTDTIVVLKQEGDSAPQIVGLTIRTVAQRQSTTPLLYMAVRVLADGKVVADDTVDMEAATLIPLRSVSHSAQSYDVAYDGLRVHGAAQGEGGTTRFVDGLSPRSFFDGGTVEAILPAIAADPDSGIALVSLNPPATTPRVVAFRPAGRDSTRDEAGMARYTIYKRGAGDYLISDDGRLIETRWTVGPALFRRVPLARLTATQQTVARRLAAEWTRLP